MLKMAPKMMRSTLMIMPELADDDMVIEDEFETDSEDDE